MEDRRLLLVPASRKTNAKHRNAQNIAVPLDLLVMNCQARSHPELIVVL